MIETFLRDLRYAFRTLAKRPGFTLVATLSLGLGIGVNSTIFTLTNAAFFHPIPVEDPDHVVVIHGTSEQQPGLFPLSHPDFEDLQKQRETLSDLAAFHWLRLNLVRSDLPERVFGQIVSERYFDVLLVKPLAGRVFGPEDFASLGGHPVAVLTYRYWDLRFGQDLGVVGRNVVLNGRKFTIIGITPKDFKGVNTLALNDPDIFVPMSMYRELSQYAAYFEDRSFRMLELVGRLQPGVSAAQAREALRIVAGHLEQEYTSSNKGYNLELIPLAESIILPQQRQMYRRAGTLLTVVAGLILLISCASVASLLLTRGIERRREVAIRLSIGAQRERLARQLLTESIALSVLGGSLGLVIAAWGPAVLWRFRPPFLTATALDLSINGRILAFTLAVSLITGFLFGLAPALQVFRADLVPALKDQNATVSRTGQRLPWRHVLIASQVALSLVALIGSGLFLRSLRNAQAIDPGFNTTNLINLRINVGAQGYQPQQGHDFFLRVLARVESLPGVRSATLSANLPLNRGAIFRRAVPEGADSQLVEDWPFIRTNVVGPRYFDTLGIPILQGRSFSDVDHEDSPSVAVVNQTMAERLWPGRNPVGQRFRTPDEGNVTFTVIGVARNAKYVTLAEPPEPLFYVYENQNHAPEMLLHVRTEGNPRVLLETVRREVQALDKTLPLADIQPMGDVLAESLWGPRMGAAMLSVFGVLALVLAVIGIYGVMSYSVNQRKREVGIRMALGARGADVLKLILRQAMLVVGTGLLGGLVVALVGSRMLSSFLHGVSGTDAGTLVTVTSFLAGVALGASYLAARRSARVNPLIAVRGE